MYLISLGILRVVIIREMSPVPRSTRECRVYTRGVGAVLLVLDHYQHPLYLILYGHYPWV